MSQEAYFERYRNVKFQRDAEGVLEVTMHTDGDEVQWNAVTHREFADAFHDISRDRRNRAVILTGTGRSFIEKIDTESMPELGQPWVWNRIYMDGCKMLDNLLDIPVPVIAAVNGAARVHSELALLCDIVLSSDDAVFQDRHIEWGIVPGDGVQIVWPHVLGPQRGKYFLLTGQKIGAAEAHQLGVVAEVLPRDKLMSRARELATRFAKHPTLTMRYTRAIFTAPLKKLVQQNIALGLALEGLSANGLGKVP